MSLHQKGKFKMEVTKAWKYLKEHPKTNAMLSCVMGTIIGMTASGQLPSHLGDAAKVLQNDLNQVRIQAINDVQNIAEAILKSPDVPANYVSLIQHIRDHGVDFGARESALYEMLIENNIVTEEQLGMLLEQTKSDYHEYRASLRRSAEPCPDHMKKNAILEALWQERSLAIRIAMWKHTEIDETNESAVRSRADDIGGYIESLEIAISHVKATHGIK